MCLTQGEEAVAPPNFALQFPYLYPTCWLDPREDGVQQQMGSYMFPILDVCELWR